MRNCKFKAPTSLQNIIIEIIRRLLGYNKLIMKQVIQIVMSYSLSSGRLASLDSVTRYILTSHDGIVVEFLHGFNLITEISVNANTIFKFPKITKESGA